MKTVRKSGEKAIKTKKKIGRPAKALGSRKIKNDEVCVASDVVREEQLCCCEDVCCC